MISNQCNYALRAMLELGKHEGAGPVSIPDIAQAQEIPTRFLEAILRQLKNADITASIRGKGGGYELARPAREITVGQIVHHIEGPIVQAKTQGQGPQISESLFSEIWHEAEQALSSVLDQTTVQDLVDKESQLRNEFVTNYNI